MKAVVITEPGGPEVLRVLERDTPSILPNEILIEVQASGVNRPDIFQRKGNYPAPEGAPQDIPGLEAAGLVKEVGDKVRNWKVGDRVCALLAGGGYADYVAVDAGQCLPIPKGLDFAEAASLPETLFTVWHNVFQRGKLKPGENLLIHGGTSGIGVTAIQLAVAWGATVFATAGTPEKCKACVDLGAKACYLYTSQDFEKELEHIGIDVVLDMVGGDYFNKNLTILRPDGRLVYINAVGGPKVELDILKMMRKRLTITGSTLRAREPSFKADLAQDIYKQVWPMIESGKFRPVIFKTFPLTHAAEAHELLESNQHIGKIVLLNDKDV